MTMPSHDPADDPGHICAELGELQPDCNAYYCRLEREQSTREEQDR